MIKLDFTEWYSNRLSEVIEAWLLNKCFGTAYYHGIDRVYRPRIIYYLFITTRLTHLRISLSINLVLSMNIVIWKLFWVISSYFLFKRFLDIQLL